MLTVRTEWAGISRRIVHKAMPDHLILPFEALSATFHRAVVRAIRGVNIHVRPLNQLVSYYSLVWGAGISTPLFCAATPL